MDKMLYIKANCYLRKIISVAVFLQIIFNCGKCYIYDTLGNFYFFFAVLFIFKEKVNQIFFFHFLIIIFNENKKSAKYLSCVEIKQKMALQMIYVNEIFFFT